MNPMQSALSLEAIEGFEAAANRLRVRFRKEVFASLPVFARRFLERDWQQLSECKVGSIPPLVQVCLLGGERCAESLLRMDYNGAAGAFFQESVLSTADNITSTVVSSRRYSGNIVIFPAQSPAPGAENLLVRRCALDHVRR